MNAFLHILLNYNKSTETGILGNIEHYYGNIETQGRGSLHLHLLIWLENRLDAKDYLNLIHDETFVKKLLNLHNKCCIKPLHLKGC